MTQPGFSQGGLTLVEVLVAMLVLSFGALGMISLGVVAARDQQLALFHHRAVSAVEDLADRIKANPAGAMAYAAAPDLGNCSSSESPAAACDPVTLASHDLAQWRAAHLPGLPASTADIEFDADGSPPAVRIELAWMVRGTALTMRREMLP